MNRYLSPHSFIAGIMLGALLTAAWFINKESVLMPPPSPTSTAVTGVRSTSMSGAISVVDQPAGSEVVVESVTVPPPGVWVAVLEVSNNSLGNVLGAALVKGPRSNVPVQLLRSTDPGRQYAVQLYRDDESGTFDLTNDSVYVDFDTGSRVVAYFKTTE